MAAANAAFWSIVFGGVLAAGAVGLRAALSDTCTLLDRSARTLVVVAALCAVVAPIAHLLLLACALS